MSEKNQDSLKEMAEIRRFTGAEDALRPLSSETMQCRDCTFRTEDTLGCMKNDIKPNGVLRSKEPCPVYHKSQEKTR